MRKCTIILAGTLVHFLLTGLLFLASLNATMRSLDFGRAWSGMDRMLEMLSNGLLYPLFLPASQLLPPLPGGWGYVLLAANSIVWGVAVYVGTVVIRTQGRSLTQGM